MESDADGGLDVAEVEAVAEPAPTRTEFPVSTFDISQFSAAGSDVQSKVAAISESFEGFRRGWAQLESQLTYSQDEIVRLQAVELDRGRMANELDEKKAAAERLEKDLAASRADALAASERATKFEEICESIKERAFELHTALQDVKAKEEQYVTDLEAAKTQLADAGRMAQDEGVARVAAEERNKQLEESVKRLEADDVVARERIAKLVEDNKTITSQVPALLVDRERLQKQFSASERENARLVSERQSLADRMLGLEEEIRTLRADLASLSSNPPSSSSLTTQSNPSNGTKEPESAAPVDDDFDLEASLERVFSAEMAGASDKDMKH